MAVDSGGPQSNNAEFLAPYRILDLTDERGIFAGHLLAQLGADVVQIEPPGGSSARNISPFSDPSNRESLFWSAYGAGKRGITLALERPEGRELLKKLAACVDILIESTSSGDSAALGIDYESLRAVNPRLIVVSITAFGAKGPKSDYAASDLIIWAAAGTLWPHRDAEGVPLRISIPQAYHHAAADAACGALIALLTRAHSGSGQHVEVAAQQSALLSAMSLYMAPAVGDNNYNPTRSPDNKRLLPLNGGKPLISKWPVRDGLVEMNLGLGPISGRSANALFAWINEVQGLDRDMAEWDWVTLAERIDSGEFCAADYQRARQVVAATLPRYTKTELLNLAQTRGILLAPIMNAGDLCEFPHLNERNYFAEVGNMKLPLPMGTACPGGTVTRLRPAPALGEHNSEVYGNWLGMSSAELDALARKEIV